MNFRSTETKEAFWMIAMIAIAFGVVVPLGGLSRAIFCTLCLGAVWLFLATVNQRLSSVFTRHWDLQLDHIPQRLWRVFVEVILQYRVVRDRPLVGILHAAVVWGFAVIVGMAGLSFRRFVLRPKALGKPSATSGLVAVLITALMVTYLLEWGVFPAGSAAWKVNWWVHTVAFFSILVVIPRSKHLHLLLSPITIFLRSETTSAMRPLREEGEHLGIS